MSFLRSISPNQTLNITRMLNAVQQRATSHWVPDYKPGPYPKTKEERAAAAKKYNLLPEEYEPYSDDDNGAGDYPKLPFESVDAKDPYYAYDHPELRRDYREPLHQKFIILFPEMMTTKKPPYNYKWGLLQFLSSGFIFAGALWYFNSTYKFNYPVLEKQIPNIGETHYIFAVDHDWVKPECICE